MLRTLSALGAAVVVASTSAMAATATFDFTDGVFTEVAPSLQPGSSLIIDEADNGVTLTIEALSNLVGLDRLFIDTTGLQVGGGGGSVLALSLLFDTDVMLESYGTLESFLVLNPSSFSLADTSGLISTGNSTAGSPLQNVFDGAPLAVAAGTVVTLVIDTPGAAVQSFITDLTVSFDDGSTAPVPVPPALLLMAGGAGLLLRKVKKQK